MGIYTPRKELRRVNIFDRFVSQSDSPVFLVSAAPVKHTTQQNVVKLFIIEGHNVQMRMKFRFIFT